MRTRASTETDFRRTRLAALAMVFALLAGLAHGWLHDAHATAKHFADQNEYCAIDKVAAVAPPTPVPPPPAYAEAAYLLPADAGRISPHRGHTRSAQRRCQQDPTEQSSRVSHPSLLSVMHIDHYLMRAAAAVTMLTTW